MRDDNCIFCKIAAGDIPSNKLFEDEDFIAILDLSPATKGHTLLIPKDHYPDLFSLPDDVCASVLQRGKKIAALLRERLGADGMNVMQNNGEIAGQTVMHYHMHLVPRYQTDPEQINWKPPQADPEVLKAVREEITQ